MERLFLKFIIFTPIVVLAIFLPPNLVFAKDNDNRVWYDTTSTLSPEKGELEEMGNYLEGRFLRAISGAAEVGILYASDVENLRSKLSVLVDCGHQYTKYSHDFLQKGFNPVIGKTFYDCVDSYKFPQFKKGEASLEKFKDYWLKCEIDERFFLKFWGSATSYELAHPLLVALKIVTELGVFVFTDEDNGSYRNAFKLYTSKGIELMLQRQSYGITVYNQKMRALLHDLEVLFRTHARFEKDQEAQKKEDQKDQDIRTSKSDLILLGKAYQLAMEASGGGELERDEKLKLGVMVANILYPKYRCLRDLQEAKSTSMGKDCHPLEYKEGKQLGDELSSQYEKFMNSTSHSSADNGSADNGSIDDRINAVFALAYMYQKMTYQGDEESARRKYYKDGNINPLLEYIEDEPVVKFVSTADTAANTSQTVSH
ncbi:hypothetical protein GAMM_10045 [Gammaproteobacteria bacterium]